MPPVTTRRDGKVECPSCRASFEYYLIHNGFNESAHGYCEECGRTVVVDLPFQDPRFADTQEFGAVTPATEKRLPRCSCGGAFRGDAAPRCPSCRTALPAVEVGRQIEANALANRKRGWRFWQRWRWQNSWMGLYAFIVDDHRLSVDWRDIAGA